MPDKEKKDLEDFGYYLYFGDVDEESSEKAIEFVLEANFNKSHKELTLIINSCGGECSSGFALIDVMRGSKIPVNTVGIGMLASMGLSIFIAGKKGSRTLTPNTSVMCHQWWSGMEGKQHELFAAIKHHKLLEERIMSHYQKCTGLAPALVKKNLFPPHDVWLSAKEAKALHLCDIIKEI